MQDPTGLTFLKKLPQSTLERQWVRNWKILLFSHYDDIIYGHGKILPSLDESINIQVSSTVAHHSWQKNWKHCHLSLAEQLQHGFISTRSISKFKQSECLLWVIITIINDYQHILQILCARHKEYIAIIYFNPHIFCSLCTLHDNATKNQRESVREARRMDIICTDG